MIVIEFKPGMSYPFLKIPLNKFTNCTLELEDIWGKEFLSIREQIIDSDNADISFNLLENFLIRKTKYNLDVNPYVSYFIENIQKSPQMITLVELIKNIGYSNKHFINIFKKNVGTTPKHFSRIKRFQNIVSLLEQKNKISWSQLAIEAGYYDQAHFINEFKNFSGLSPTHYDKVKGDYPNYIPMVR
jgi:AraC-like DNA-binding protein